MSQEYSLKTATIPIFLRSRLEHNKLTGLDVRGVTYRHRISSVMGFKDLDLCRSSDHFRLHQRHTVLFPESRGTGPD
jgi:hypothetical protein